MKSTNTFIAMVVFAFIAVISFFNIDSAEADKQGLNPLFIALGISSGLTAIYFLYRTIVNTKQ